MPLLSISELKLQFLTAILQNWFRKTSTHRGNQRAVFNAVSPPKKVAGLYLVVRLAKQEWWSFKYCQRTGNLRAEKCFKNFTHNTQSDTMPMSYLIRKCSAVLVLLPSSKHSFSKIRLSNQVQVALAPSCVACPESKKSWHTLFHHFNREHYSTLITSFLCLCP